MALFQRTEELDTGTNEEQAVATTIRLKSLVLAVSENTGVSRPVVNAVCNEFVKELAAAMEEYSRIKMGNFGTIKVRSTQGLRTNLAWTLPQPSETEAPSEQQ